MGRTCDTHGRVAKYLSTEFWWENLKEADLTRKLENADMDLKNGMGGIHLAQDMGQ
jgi:hypothetical protein